MRCRDHCPAYPPIGDYALLSDCHSVALVSRHGSIDWCAMPRMDRPSVFGRLLDWERGGYCVICPSDLEASRLERRYLDGSLVLETRFRQDGGEVRLVDFFAMREGGREEPHRQLARLVEGVEGEMELTVHVVPRLAYAAVEPWTREHEAGFFTAIGGDAGLVLCSDMGLEVREDDDGDPSTLKRRLTVSAGDRHHLSIQFVEPHRLHPEPREGVRPERKEWQRFEETLEWWETWDGQSDWEGDPRVLTSAAVIKGLTNAPTGAIAAAATTSLPEHVGGERNWDYRYSWIRDSAFALEALGALGFTSEAEGFRDFVERTTAAGPEHVQPLYGLGGEVLLPEVELDHLEGYRGSRPVRIGNGAYRQLQLDSHGELLDLAWRSARRGSPPSADYWRFLGGLVDVVAERWREPDRGFWEVRDGDHHFVHSKVTCWAALERGALLAEDHGLEAPVEAWREARDEVRRWVEGEGVAGGSFVRELGGESMDASLLLLPRYGFVAWDDPRMVVTADRVRDELSDDHGLVRRYRGDDGLEGEEGCFIACTFWLAECLARQGRGEEARDLFHRAADLANDLGLFAEEADAASGELLGNFPQGLSHYSYVNAAVALSRLG